MKRTNRIYTKPYMFRIACIALALSLVLTACNEEELLNPVPETSLGADFLFANPERVLGQINGMYAGVKNGSFLGGRNLMLNDIRGEDFLNRTQNVFTGYDAWLHTVNSGSADAVSTWGAAYTAINAANLLIDGLAAHPNAVNSVLAAQYIGEAKFVRALCYHYLTTMYGQPYLKDNGASPAVPLRLKGESTTANNDLGLSTVAEVYTQILKDLDEAELALPLTYSTPLLNTTRAHRNTAIALKTRVYLSMGNYAKVIAEAGKIVSDASPFKALTGVAHQLQPNIATIFSENYTTVESVFSMPMTQLNNVGGQSGLATVYTSTFEYNLNPSGIYGDPSWRATDARKVNFTTAKIGNTTGPFITKYKKVSPNLDYVPIIRYAEVLLNYAEAAAKTGSLPKAIALLTAVRTRSDATYIFPAEAVATPEALVSTIWIERRIELIGEGFRARDIMRSLLTFPAKGSGGLNAPAISLSQPEYVFPIPNSERSTNKGL
ncbi:RagB/SusD family nutrient uptake outer membrane protein [Pedobacter sp. P351]|uniref:RagB/SusD family nutrient uptake outer membrane protein n=1 Tax=Pedobacter superstes TaxID=3133441 RepID=UPI0030A9F35B